MRRTLILMLLFVATFMAQTASAQVADQSVKLTMSFNNEPLSQVFLRLESSSPYKFLYTYDDVDSYTVTGKMRNAPFFDILKFVLKDTPLEYSVQGKFINITLKDGAKRPASTGARPEGYKTIGGYVFDEHNEPVIGAQVRVVGTKLIAVTDINGAFNFEYLVPANSQIQVSYVGMQTVTVPVKKEMTIRMKSDTKALGEVVVTGIFRKAKESYTGAVSTIDREQLDLYRGTNLIQTLKNIDASINFPINNVAGSNPNVLPNLNIRGSSSLPMSVEEFNSNAAQTVNTPLIILDGFEISLQKLMDYNDEQIESINILKDAAATAIYGSRGANGVIVVVTKTPKEGKLRVTAKAGISLEIPDLSSYDLLNAAEKLELERRIGLYDQRTPASQINYQDYYNNRYKAILEGTDIDWMSKPLRNGVGQRYNIQLDGGSGEFRWGASVGYNNIAGAMKGSERNTLTGDITLLYSVKNLIFRNYTSVTSNKAKESKYGSFQNYVNMEPYDNPYDEEGNLVKTFFSLNTSTGIGNPLWDASLNTINKSDYFEFTNNFSVEWLITEGLRLRAKMGVTTHKSSSDLFYPASHSMFTTSEFQSISGLMRRGRYTYGTGDSDLLSGNLTMSYTKTFNDKHQVYVGADYSISEEKYKNLTFVAEGFSNDNLNFMPNALQYMQNGTPTGDRTTVCLVGFTGNVNYTYDNRYYVDLSYRIDGSSKFGSNKRFAPFWSVGIGWNIHNEKFMKDQTLFNNLRVKASYGVTGSQDFSTESVYTSYRYTADGRYLNWSAANVMGIGNPDLTWQKTKEVNLGLEFGIQKNRINGEINWFSKTTSNLLSEMDIPLSSGFASYIANVGELKNHGVEASLNAYLVRDYEKQFNWMIGGQLVYNWNEISKLSDAIIEQNRQYLEQNVDVSNLFYVGRPMNSIYAVRSAGIDPSTGKEVFINKDGDVTANWNASDKVYLGSSQPLWRGNLRNMIMWKNFTLNVSFAYHWGGKLYNSTLRDRVELSPMQIAEKNVDARVLSSRWMQPGDNTFFRNFKDLTSDMKATSRYVFNDRVLELQSVSLQYRWNTNWLRNMTKLESIVFAINANDLFYWSSVKYERGTSYPYARNVQGTITLTF